MQQPGCLAITFEGAGEAEVSLVGELRSTDSLTQAFAIMSQLRGHVTVEDRLLSFISAEHASNLGRTVAHLIEVGVSVCLRLGSRSLLAMLNVAWPEVLKLSQVEASFGRQRSLAESVNHPSLGAVLDRQPDPPGIIIDFRRHLDAAGGRHG